MMVYAKHLARGSAGAGRGQGRDGPVGCRFAGWKGWKGWSRVLCMRDGGSDRERAARGRPAGRDRWDCRQQRDARIGKGGACWTALDGAGPSRPIQSAEGLAGRGRSGDRVSVHRGTFLREREPSPFPRQVVVLHDRSTTLPPVTCAPRRKPSAA